MILKFFYYSQWKWDFNSLLASEMHKSIFITTLSRLSLLSTFDRKGKWEKGIKEFTQGQTSRKWWNWNWNPDSWGPESRLLTATLHSSHHLDWIKVWEFFLKRIFILKGFWFCFCFCLFFASVYSVLLFIVQNIKHASAFCQANYSLHLVSIRAISEAGPHIIWRRSMLTVIGHFIESLTYTYVIYAWGLYYNYLFRWCFPAPEFELVKNQDVIVLIICFSGV